MVWFSSKFVDFLEREICITKLNPEITAFFVDFDFVVHRETFFVLYICCCNCMLIVVCLKFICRTCRLLSWMNRKPVIFHVYLWKWQWLQFYLQCEPLINHSDDTERNVPSVYQWGIEWIIMGNQLLTVVWSGSSPTSFPYPPPPPPRHLFLSLTVCRGLSLYCAGIFEQSMGAWNRVGRGWSYRPARARIFKESIPNDKFLQHVACCLSSIF